MKIKDGFAYVTKTKEDFDDFMRTAEEMGFRCMGDKLPTKSGIAFLAECYPMFVVVGKILVLCHVRAEICEDYINETKRTKLWCRRKPEERAARDRFLTTMVVVLLMAVIGLCALAVRGVVRPPWTMIAILPTCVLLAVAMYFLLCRREEEIF